METVDLDNAQILTISAVYRFGDDCLKLSMGYKLEFEDIEEVSLDGPYAGYSLQRGSWNNEGVYSSVAYTVGDWNMYLSYSHERMETFNGEDIVVSSFPTEDEMLVFLDVFMAETSLEELIAGLGIE